MRRQTRCSTSPPAATFISRCGVGSSPRLLPPTLPSLVRFRHRAKRFFAILAEIRRRRRWWRRFCSSQSLAPPKIGGRVFSTVLSPRANLPGAPRYRARLLKYAKFSTVGKLFPLRKASRKYCRTTSSYVFPRWIEVEILDAKIADLFDKHLDILSFTFIPVERSLSASSIRTWISRCYWNNRYKEI